MAEVNSIWAAQSRPETVLNLGLRKPVNEGLVLLASLGRPLSATAERSQLLFYLGVQILR